MSPAPATQTAAPFFLAGATRAELTTRARRNRRARARAAHARRPALALDLPSRRARVLGDAQRRPAGARRARRALHAGAARDRRRAGFRRRHPQVAVAHAARLSRRQAAPRSRASTFPKPTAARCAFRARSAARSTARSATPAPRPWARNLTAAEIVGQVLVARDRLGDFPGGDAADRRPRAFGRRRARGLQRRLHGHGRAALQFRRRARGDRDSDRRRRLVAFQAAHHRLDLRRRAGDGAARRRMRDDAGGVAARDQRCAARQAGAAQPEIPDRDAAARPAATIPAPPTRGASPSNT